MANEPFVGDRLGKRDLILATIVGLVFTVIYLIFSPRGIDPTVWEDLAVASGLHPPRTIFPAFWRLAVTGLISLFGVEGAARSLRFFGALVGGGCVFFVALLLRQTFAYLMRVKDRSQWDWIAPFFTAIGAVCFGAGDSMWRMVAPLTPGGIRFFLLLLSLHVFFRWLKQGGLARLFFAYFLSGCLAAETPLAFVLPLLFYILFRLVVSANVNGAFLIEGDLFQSGVRLPKWRMFFSFLLGLAVAVIVNVNTFIRLGGLVANGWSVVDIFFHYAIGYYIVFTKALSPIGWMLAVVLTILPLVGVLVLFPRLCRDTEPLNFKLGLLLLFAGIVATLQGSVISLCRFWNFSADAVNLNSEFLEGVFLLVAVITMTSAMTCFAHGCQFIYDYDQDEGTFTPAELRGSTMRYLVPVIAVLCSIPAVLRIYRPAEFEMRAIVDEALTETIRECGDAKFVFTDGRLDAGLELKAAQLGSALKPLNMFSGGSEWEKTMRTRYFDPQSGDYESVKIGVPVLLRIWAGEREDGMDHAATQLGFEFWRRARKPLPVQSGFVARPKGMSDADVTSGIAIANKLAQRILFISKNYSGAVAAASLPLRNALSSVSWRISRFARMRDEEDLANELDEWNDTVKHLMRMIEYERNRTFMQLTPYEGLRLALHRADFSEARRYGATVLQIDANDPEANFGTGMAYLMEDKLKEAEIYLERTLKARPEEPAVLNNLSIIYRKTSRIDKAYEYVKKAHELAPDNEEIQRTLKDTERVIQSREDTLKKVFTK